MVKKQDTIYALSTPPGKSAIAVIRISGKKAFDHIKKMSSSMPTKPNTSTLNKLITQTGEVIDQTITTYYKAPKSFTGENMVEISTHGGNAVINKLIDVFKKNKRMRLADPGEFTRRSFENNKLDLTQVEAIADLINAETEYQRKQAYSQLEGNLTIKTKEIYNELTNVLANTEATIDFVDEELPKDLLNNTKEQIENISNKINNIIKNNNKGRKIREGFVVGIIGNTNTGKSSFINNISNQEIAIVSNKPGTTRDAIESYIDIRGLPVRFFDTAGIRKHKNIVEKIGIKKSKTISKEADLNLIFINKTPEINDFKGTSNPIFVQSKYDIRNKPIKSIDIMNISSKTNFGINNLLKAVFHKLSENNLTENTYISRERHIRCLIETRKYLEKSKEKKNYDVFSEDIRLATKEISKIYGKIDIENILDIIFSDFCIGK
jgi:tRNA modification GTPase|tara:strand:- start:3189 stop:4496 length:1308 start_codon:yes stop_codon:yes gene_type:complete